MTRVVQDQEERRLAVKQAVAAGFPTSSAWAAIDRGALLLRVVSNDFDGLDEEARRRLLAERMPADVLDQAAVLELLTVQEEQWWGPVFRETAANPPVWSSVLPVVQPPGIVTFASDLDEGLNSCPIVTFYSLRGGVGRSTALASVARILTAERRLRVLCIDMDLEAPGLADLFGVSDLVTDDRGVLAALEQLEVEDIDVLKHVVPVDDAGRLFCLPAGRLGGAYADRLASLDIELWYREQRNPLHRLLEAARSSTLRPDAIIIDSRTGFSPIAGPLLFDVSDLAVVFFHPQSQGRAGTELLTAAMLASHTQRASDRPLTPEPRFVVSPMPPGPSSVRLAERAAGWVESWLSPLTAARGAQGSLSAVDALHVVNYNADVAFRDQVAVDPAELLAYGPISDWILQLVPEKETVGEGGLPNKSAILKDLVFESSTAETQVSLLEAFVVTDQVRRAADPASPLVVGRKGTGKTALFRWLAESADSAAILVASPNLYAKRPTWSLGEQGLVAVERALADRSHTWSTYWLVVACLAVEASLRDQGVRLPPVPGGFTTFAADDTEATTVASLVSAFDNPMAGLLATDWLQRVGTTLPAKRLLLFDGLDTAFGSSAGYVTRRTEAVSALLAVQADLGLRAPQLPFKIMLRHDVWESLRLENKSHFFGLQLQLRWDDRADFYRVVLKRATRTDAFTEALNKPHQGRDVDQWSTDEVEAAWTLLVSERMKGEQTAFTWNWVWNRLADGNGDHSPRTLLGLFTEALRRERMEHARNPYERSVIRPRLLIPSLMQVSEAALDALVSEEFPELRAVTDALRAHGRTPLSVAELGVSEELLDLAADAGLVSVREDVTGRSVRVPDLYRHGLAVTRRGPA